jgi:hypothetical protein
MAAPTWLPHASFDNLADLARSANDGTSWTEENLPASETGGGFPASSLSYVSRTVGWVVVGGTPRLGGLLRTSDAGVHWHKVSF